nr:MAG TPA: hypothetical protein [Caudoviricetes sp.]
MVIQALPLQNVCRSFVHPILYRSKIFLPPLACGSTSLVKG